MNGPYIHGEAAGKKSTKEYKTWTAIRERCRDPDNPKNARYAARGIKVCDRWLHSFPNFLADMGRAPGPGPAWSIDRIDNDGDYEPGNCRWATRKQQNRNTRRTSGALVSRELAESVGVHHNTIRARVVRGMPMGLASQHLSNAEVRRIMTAVRNKDEPVETSMPYAAGPFLARRPTPRLLKSLSFARDKQQYGRASFIESVLRKRGVPVPPESSKPGSALK